MSLTYLEFSIMCNLFILFKTKKGKKQSAEAKKLNFLKMDKQLELPSISYDVSNKTIILYEYCRR